MPIPELNASGHLPRGIHDASLDEIAEAFGYGSRRLALMADLRRYVSALIRWPLAQALLIDGSFVTDHAEPNDIDVILVLRGDYDLTQAVSPYEYNLRSTKMVRKAYRLDLFAVRPNSLEYDRFVDLFSACSWSTGTDQRNAASRSMIENHAGLVQARRQLQNMEEVVAELMRGSSRVHPSQLSLQLEGPMEVIRQLRAEIDEYLGIKQAEELLSAQHP